MAATTKLLHLRPLSRPIPNPSLSHFSSSTTPTPPPSDPPSETPPPPQPKSSFSAYFNDVKASLNNPPPPQHRPFQNPPNSSDPSPKIESLGDIRKNLSEFRRVSPSSGTPGQSNSFQELYNRNVNKAAEEKPKVPGFSAIRESLKNLQSKNAGGGGLGSFSSFNNALNKKLEPKRGMLGGSEALPLNIFGKEAEGKGEGGVDDALKGEFFKAYSSKELGMKLINLRPKTNKDERNWFSLQELNERLHKLRVADEKEMENSPKTHFSEIRASLVKIVKSDMEKKASVNVQNFDLLNLGADKDFMLSPPKENLVEKYFHPDNMSSAEKMKIELKKVRDEFKMSESDCGSARVQVAQLTTKIKHLSSTLHKKDKHSRKGLQGMVQQRKKLLKYLRRTDWDSYCMVLSKLGLRDNPDYKNL